jgi:protocatechuate 3,4-dioxygenase beta subunit
MHEAKWLTAEEIIAVAQQWRCGDPWSRRRLLAALAGALAALVVPAPLRLCAGDGCAVTPPQTEGPFYPVHDQPDKDNDLTRMPGAPGRAAGQIMHIEGSVRDAACRPIPGATVEIWQANANGRYNHPDDRNTRAASDPHFQHWGLTATDRDGRYMFKTVVPAPYPAGFFWTRPAHIHFKVHRRGSPTLTTQMYFAGDPYLARDRIFQAIPRPARPRVVVSLAPPGPEYDPDVRLCRFNLIV